MKTIFKKYLNLSTMKEEQMDNIFRQKLGQHDSGTPEHLWAGIEAKRKKPNGGALWMPWITGLAIFISVGTLVWYFFPESTTERNTTVELTTPIANTESTPIATQEVATITEDETKQNAAAVEQEVISTAHKTDAPASAEMSLQSNEEAISKTIISETPPEANSGQALSGNVVSSSQTTTAAPIETVEAKEEATTSKSLEEISRLPQLKSELLAISFDESQIKGPEGCYAFGGRERILDAIYFDAIGGPELAMRTLSTRGDGEFDFYKEARDSTERAWYAFGSTLRANMRYESGLVLRAGVNYSQINEIFEVRDGNATQTIITEIKDAQGNVISTKEEIIEGELYKKIHNRLRFIDVPVMLGYEKTNKKFTYAVNAGVSFNFQTMQKGEFLSEQLEPVVFTSEQPGKYDYFDSKIGMTFLGSVGMSYQMTGNLDIHVEPRVRYFPNSIGDGALKQKYLNVGVYAGLRYYFICKQRK